MVESQLKDKTFGQNISSHKETPIILKIDAVH